MSVLHPRWAANGWEFGDTPMSTVDRVAGRHYLYEVYQAAKPDFTGKVTVPVLWDKKTATIVNNESGEIIRMLNSAFDAWGDASIDFYPDDLPDEISSMNAFVLDKVCNGVYKAGFATTQSAYDRAVQELFEALDALEELLSQQLYLLGERITESDWHLFCTLCRFDAVYYGALKCNLKRLIDYPALSAYTHRIYNLPFVAETVKMDHIKQHYYDDLKAGNPTIVPVGPAIDFRLGKVIR
jgi:putative glutathione S-transferase